jgi:hypothetical protein
LYFTFTTLLVYRIHAQHRFIGSLSGGEVKLRRIKVKLKEIGAGSGSGRGRQSREDKKPAGVTASSVYVESLHSS